MNERNLTKTETETIDLAKHIQQLVNYEFNRVKGKLEPESALAQAGLHDGLEIVSDYISHGEIGIAFEHLLYMSQETGIELSDDIYTRLNSVADELGMSLSNSFSMFNDRVC